MTTLAPEAIDESLDPRDPLLRLSRFFDDGSIQLLHERDRSGVLAAGGTVNGLRTIAFATDGTVMGGAMGLEGCTHIVNAYDTAMEEQSPIVGIWHSGGARLAEGVKALHAVGFLAAEWHPVSVLTPVTAPTLTPAIRTREPLWSPLALANTALTVYGFANGLANLV